LKGGAKKIGKFLNHNIHVGHEGHRPGFSPGNEERKESHELKKQVEDMQKIMQEMGQLLNTVVVRMHSEYVSSNTAKEPFEDSVLLESIATLKHCKDVLLGRLSIHDYLQFLAENPMSASTQLTPPGGTQTAAVPTEIPFTETEDVDPLAIIFKAPLSSTPPPSIASSSNVRVISSLATPTSVVKVVPLGRPLSDAARAMLDSVEPESSLFTASPRNGSSRKVEEDEFPRLKSDSTVANPLLAELLG